MSPRSILMLILIAIIAVCGIAEASWAEAGANKWPDQKQLKDRFQQCHLSKPPEGVPANEARAATLDYENQCYRQLTEIEHAKLGALQDAASRNRARKVADRTLLQREPLAKCELSKPPEGVPENEARLAKLDYENQCYRQLAERELGKLDALEEAAGRPPEAAGRIAQSPKPVHRIHHRWIARRQPSMITFQATR
jgi:hypothetical protein